MFAEWYVTHRLAFVELIAGYGAHGGVNIPRVDGEGIQACDWIHERNDLARSSEAGRENALQQPSLSFVVFPRPPSSFESSVADSLKDSPRSGPITA
jgi:hypothetical protein